jgi:superfamily II DNA/RNA helicase
MQSFLSSAKPGTSRPSGKKPTGKTGNHGPASHSDSRHSSNSATRRAKPTGVDIAAAVADVAGSGYSSRPNPAKPAYRAERAEREAPRAERTQNQGDRRGPDRSDSRNRPNTGYSQSRARGNAPRDGRGASGDARQRGGRVKQYIDPAKFVRKAVAVQEEEYVPEFKFTDFKVHKKIIENLIAKGYKVPTPIQDQTIQLVLDGHDVVGIANTGTGKTAAFSVPLIHDLVTNMENRLLIMAPTRELAQQIVDEMLSFSKGCGLKIALVIGGASMHLQTRALAQNPRIVVGTPGRIKDHIGQGTLNLARFNRVVLDEVDRMLDMGFIRDITAILSKVNSVRQSLFFSATMEGETEKLICRFAREPVTVSTKKGITADSVNQDVIWYRGKDDKIGKLHDLLISQGRGKAIIFDDTKHQVEKLCKELVARGFSADRIHGNKSQAQRSRAISKLKSGEIDILVATDVAARGLDVSDITHVINYSQPTTYDDYVHRIGRTGRAGKAGLAYTFLEQVG